MRTYNYLLTGFVLLTCFSASAINFSRVNLAWQYDLNFDVKMAHRVVSIDNGTMVFLRVSTDSLAAWSFEFLAQSGYESEDHKTLTLAPDTLNATGNDVFLKLVIPKMDENLLVIKFSRPDNFYYYDITLSIGGLSFPSIYPVDHNGLPIVEKYINRSGFSWIGNDTVLVAQYPEEFPPADPPMADMKPIAAQADMDTAYYFTSDTSFVENKFYNVLKDSSVSLGVTLLRVPPYFPKYRQLIELIESMLYLTSEQEKKAILRSRQPKQSFDSFWMNTYSTKSRARGAIRRYYDLVQQANTLFTNFKPGWKTDPGMMYIVYGLPNEVYRTGNSEEWYYDDGSAFEFTVISTFFAPRTYLLRRSKELEEQWFSKLATIRRE